MLDETTVAERDTARSSEGNAGTTSQETQTYTREMVDKMVNDALSAGGRKVKAATEAAEKAQAALEQLQKEQDEAEAKQLGDDPEALTLHQRKKALRDERAEFAREKAELEKAKEANAERLADLDKAKREKEATEIATRHNVDAKLVAKYGGEDMEAFARDLPKLTASSKRPDSGVTIGGGDSFSSMSPKERMAEADRRLRAK